MKGFPHVFAKKIGALVGWVVFVWLLSASLRFGLESFHDWTLLPIAAMWFFADGFAVLLLAALVSVKLKGEG